MKKIVSQLSILLLLVFCMQNQSNAQTGTWTKVTNLEPYDNMGAMILLTDGTVICHNNNGGPDNDGTGWDKLTPSTTGSYANGTWTSIKSMNQERYVFPSQVLPSGKVWVAGGEYGVGDTAGEVYDPVANTWTRTEKVPGTQYNMAAGTSDNIYDGNSEMLPDGRILVGPQIGPNPSNDCLFYTPSTNTWATAPIAPQNHDEAAWIKLPDSSILFVGIQTTTACRYRPQTNTWISDASTPDSLFDIYGGESGSANLLPNGKAIFFGATGHNCIYTPSGTAAHGSWVRSADFPFIGGSETGMVDAPSAMLVNGHILIAVSPIGTSATNEFLSPTYFLEYDYTTDTYTQVTATLPGIGSDELSNLICQSTLFLPLPDGTVLMGINQDGHASKQYYIYTPGSGPIAAGKPTINSILPDGCPYYKITGKLFNGISEGSGYGDDWQNYTNYPLVRLTNSGGNVYYCKTTNWNRIGAVMTDSLEDTTVFETPAALPAGTYSLVVIANGFASNPTIFTTLGITISSYTNVLCNGSSTGTATATTATGGIHPYTYKWTPGGGTNISATGLSAGNYTVTVTDNNGCTETASVAITQPATAVGITIASHTNTTCNGTTGSITANAATGGTSPYIYTWSLSGGSNLTASSLSFGTYTITAEDHNGCTATAAATITQTGSTVAVTIASHMGVLCNGGSTGSTTANIATGGVTPYTYIWVPSGGTNLAASNLSAGTYTVIAEDNNGCDGSASVSITQPALLTVSTTVTASVSCMGGSNGSVSSSPTGGTTPYTYSWSGGGNASVKSGLTAGTYTITVTDKNGCGATASVTVTQPATALSVTDSTTANVTCLGGSNGSISSSPTGGTSPYTYLWSGGGTGASKTGLTAGTYTITITDNGGCIATATVAITQPATGISTTANTTTDVTCLGGSNGSASSSPSGGATPYTYSWSGGGTGASKTGLTAGTYTITVTDKHGCTATATVSITQPATGISAAASVATNLTCNGGNNASVTSSPTGGTSPYTYAWSGGGTNSTKTGLTAGTYTITITDNKGCSSTAKATVTDPAAIVISNYSIPATPGSCNGIAAATVISGGTAPYTYLWTPGGLTTDTIKSQCINTYCCLITDKNGCKDSSCVDITTTGIDNISDASNISIYPDPNNGSFTVAGVIQGQIIEVYNNLGQNLSSAKADKTTMYFDISTKADGIYLVRILNKDGSVVTQKKIIKAQ